MGAPRAAQRGPAVGPPRAAVAVAVALVAAAGAALAAAVSGGGTDSAARARPEPVRHVVDAEGAPLESVRTDPGDRALVVFFLGAHPSCRVEHVPEVDERDDAVTVTVRDRDLPADGEIVCPMVGISMSRRVELRRPLGSRVLFDGATGRRWVPFDGDDLLEPSYLPEGWQVVREAGGEGRRVTTWRRSFGGAGGCATVWQFPATNMPAYAAFPRVGTAEVRGHDAQLAETPEEKLVRWIEGERGFAVRSSRECSTAGPVALDVLVRIADGLRTPARSA